MATSKKEKEKNSKEETKSKSSKKKESSTAKSTKSTTTKETSEKTASKKKTTKKKSSSTSTKKKTKTKTTPKKEKKVPSSNSSTQKSTNKSTQKNDKGTKKKNNTKEKTTAVVTASAASAVVQSSYEPDKSESSERLTQLASFLSGEKQLKEKESEIDALKKEAIEMQKDLMRRDIAAGEVVLESSPNYVESDILATGGARKVVQKIKLYEWKSPIRVQFPFDTKLFAGIVVLALIFILYLAVLGQYGLMFSIIALLFFLYVAGTTEPMMINHMITTRGVETLEKMYEWYMLDRFWFSKKNDEYVLLVETRLRAPTKLIMLVDKKDITPVFILLQDKLLYKDMRKQGRLSRMTYGEYIPIEKI